MSLSRQELLSAIKQIAYLEGQFTTRSGKSTNYYVDKYLFETQPSILKALAIHLAPLLPPSSDYDLIAAPELGAVSIAAVLSIEVNKPFVIVRKASKDYGTQRRLEGQYQTGDRVVIVEDILTTGGAALQAHEQLLAAGTTVSHIIGVLNREEGAFDNILAVGVEPRALFTTTELLNASASLSTPTSA